MVRPQTGSEPLDQRVQVMMGASEVATVDDWMFANRVRTRSEAIRQLIARGKLWSTLLDKAKTIAKGARVTGLWKKCPRCGRVGELFVDDKIGPFIVWEGEARSSRKAGFDADTNLQLEDLLDSTFGCGYDDVDSPEAE